MSEQPPNEANNPPENKRNENRRPGDLQRRIAEALVLALYFVFEFPSAFQESHARAFVQVFFGVCAVLLIELTLTIWAITSALVFVLLATAYLYLGPTPPPPPPKPTIGWLQPANDPMPDNGCVTHLDKRDVALLIVGDTGYVMPNRNYSTEAVTLGWCRSLTLHSTDNGISIDAQIFGQDGKKIGSVENNGYRIDGDLIVDKDLNTIVVHDALGTELLWVRYLNERAIRVRGNFFCPAPHAISVKVTNNSIVDYLKNSFSHGCFSLTGRARFVAVWK